MSTRPFFEGRVPAIGVIECSAASLSLRVQQTLEALDLFRVAAGLPIIRVTEMLHHTTFWKVRVPLLHNCPNFSSQNSRGNRDGRLNVGRVVVRCANR